MAARFTLDAMPGKQMAIDADLSSGLIDEQSDDEARREDGLGLAQELPDHVVVEASVGHGPGRISTMCIPS